MGEITDTTQNLWAVIDHRHSTRVTMANCQFGVSKAPAALSLSLSCWFKICMTQHLFPINRERQWGRDREKKQSEGEGRRKADQNRGQELENRDREGLRGRRRETKRYRWKDRGHSSQLIGELVRLMDRKKDLIGIGQLIRIWPC